ncbi:MAG: hypothetical protein ACRDD1_07840, partial [Planctomycetia bacterium]
VARLFIFALRFADQLMRRYAGLFNRNIILFEPEEAETAAQRHRYTLLQLRTTWQRRIVDLTSTATPAERVKLTGWRLGQVEQQLEEVECQPAILLLEPAGGSREIAMEAVVDALVEMTPEQLVERIGKPFADSIDRYVRLFDLPLIRRLPAVKDLLSARERGSEETAALAANYVGHGFQSVMGVVYYAADLQATISAPMFLDRLGTAVVNATARPAKRLLMLGGAMVLVYIAIQFVPFLSPLDYLASKLESLLGYPLLVMGGICLVLWMAGEWLKRIANRTSDELDRVAEAQFAAQTKLIKVRHRERDLRFLQERIIVPELHLRSCDDAPAAEGGTAAVAAIDGEFHGRAGDAPAKPTGGLSSHPLLESLPEVDARPEELIFLRNLELLYQDYLDGSLFHRNDTKTAMQLLGNVALNNLRQSNLEMQSKSRRRLKNLDVNQAAGAILGGPFVWFNYITRMVSQQTAKLLLDYNRHAIPLDRLASAPRHERERFREWMARRLGLPLQEIELPVPTGDLGDQVLVDPSPRRKNAAPFFETVDFTAVDFLAGDADRESLLATKYGNQLMAMVRRDRENNVRRAFGTYPLHDVPASSRTINLFTLYDSYLARGQVLLLPFRLVGGIFRLAAFGCKALVRAVDD